MRMWLPDLRTLPSRMLATPSFSPTVRRSSFFPLKENDDVRPATLSSGILTSELSSSSVRPSEKYSCSASELMLTKGSTASELVEVVDFGPRFVPSHQNAAAPPTTRRAPAAIQTARLRGACAARNAPDSV